MNFLIYFIMKNNIQKIIIIFFFILIFIKKDIMYATIYKTTMIWFKSIVPSLFPMFIITSLVVSSNLIINICNIFGKPFKYLFNTSIFGFFVFFLSLFTGCPSNAKYIKDLLDNKLISKAEQNKLLIFSLNFNPILIYNLTNTFLEKKDSIIIISIIIITNIILGIIIRNKKVELLNNNYIQSNLTISIIIKNTIDTLLMILGTLIFYNIIINLLPIKNMLLKNIINGFLEITTSLSNLKYLNISTTLKKVLTLIYLSFGGLSIHTQIKSILPDIKYNVFFKYRIIAIFISLSLLLIF